MKGKVVAQPKAKADSCTREEQVHSFPHTKASIVIINPLFVWALPPKETHDSSNSDSMEVNTTIQTNDERSPRDEDNPTLVRNLSSPFEEKMIEY